jgi:hypothetical protein
VAEVQRKQYAMDALPFWYFVWQDYVTKIWIVFYLREWKLFGVVE